MTPLISKALLNRFVSALCFSAFVVNVDQPMSLLLYDNKLIELISIRKLGVVSYIVSNKVVAIVPLSSNCIYVVEFPLGIVPLLQHICDDRKSFPTFLYWPSNSPMVHI